MDEPVRIVDRQEFREEYVLPEGVQLLVDDGDEVEAGMLLAATLPSLEYEAETGEDSDIQPIQEVVASVNGRVELDDGVVAIVWEDPEEREYPIPAAAELLVSDGDQVRAGDRLTEGVPPPHNPQNLAGKSGILEILGTKALQKHLIDEVQKVYRSQGVEIHDKHIEIILRQMMRRVQVKSIGDSDFIPDQVVDKIQFQENCGKVLAEGGEPATAELVLLGVTRASLRTDSFLAAASFQETTRVLTQAAVSGQHDYLQGLKENVIIGRLIPAKLESTLPPEEPETPALPNFDQMGEVQELVAAGWLEAGEGNGGGPMVFGGNPESLTSSGFFVEAESSPVNGGSDDGAQQGGLGLVVESDEDTDFDDFPPIDDEGI